MSGWYEHRGTVDSRDVDGFGRCRPSALLGHLQQAATLAAREGGFGREALMDRWQAVWMLARLWYRLDRPIRYEQQLSIHTWHRGGRGASMYRDFDLYADGEPVGEAVSLWTLVRPEDGKLIRLSQLPELAQSQGGERSKTMTLAHLRMPGEPELAERRLMHYSDTDINAHVNNTRYADFACDAIGLHRYPHAFVSRLQLDYHAQCLPGELLHLLVDGQEEERFVRGVDENGKIRFDAALKLGQDIP